MYTEFHINASELDGSFLKNIRSIFKKRKISIVVQDEMDETEYLLSSPANKKALEKAIKNVESGKLIEVDIAKYRRKK